MMDARWRRVRSTGRLLLAAGLLLAGSACIIRAESVEDRRQTFERRRLGDVILPSAPGDLTSVGAELDDGVRLIGWAADPPTPRPGERVTIDFYWEALDAPQDDWKVFVHLEPPEGRGTRLIGDHEPAGGRYPTNVWREGDIVRDRWQITIPAYHSAPSLELWTGFYRGETRMAVRSRRGIRTDGQNRVLAGVLPTG